MIADVLLLALVIGAFHFDAVFFEPVPETALGDAQRLRGAHLNAVVLALGFQQIGLFNPFQFLIKMVRNAGT